MPELSVVIPVYNEEKCIKESVRRVEAFMGLKNWDWELIVSSDGSTDSTESVVRPLTGDRVKLLSAVRNEGKGAAVRRGVLAARGRVILVTDADLSAPVKEVDKLIGFLEQGYDVAIGSRAVQKEGCDVQQSPKRLLAGRIFNFFVRILVLKDFKDTQCGFKCFTREAAHRLFAAQTLDGFCFDIEILCLAKKFGLKVIETPVMWRQSPRSAVHMLRDSLRMLRELFYLRKKYR